MVDVVNSATRSRMMRGIKGVNTAPEMRVRRQMHAAGLRYRLHQKDLPGRPDLVFPSLQTVVFVHGCFWHQHPGCRYASTPATNTEFWASKLRGNVDRDRRTINALEADGWTVSIIWECSSDRDLEALTAAIAQRAEARRTRVSHVGLVLDLGISNRKGQSMRQPNLDKPA